MRTVLRILVDFVKSHLQFELPFASNSSLAAIFQSGLYVLSEEQQDALTGALVVATPSPSRTSSLKSSNPSKSFSSSSSSAQPEDSSNSPNRPPTDGTTSNGTTPRE